MARYFDLRSTVLVVVGHGILPEEEDRPIAYDLKREINARAGGSEGRSAVVVTDVWIMNPELSEFFPAISIGGPGVNAFTAHIYEDLPGRSTETSTPSSRWPRTEERAALLGHGSGGDTRGGFVADGLFERFLDLVWRQP